jgi:hypothetical protein
LQSIMRGGCNWIHDFRGRIRDLPCTDAGDGYYVFETP